MLKEHNNFLKNLMLFNDLLFVSLAWWLAYVIRFHTDLFIEPEPYIFSHYLIAWLVILLIWAVVFGLLDLYRPRQLSTYLREAVDLINRSGLALLIFLGILFFVRELVLSRIVMGLFWVSSSLFLHLSHVVFREGLRYLRRRGYNVRHVLIIGALEQVRRLLNKLEWYRYLGLKGFGKSQTPIATVFVWGIWALMLLGNLAFVNTYTWNYPFSDELDMITRSLTPQWLWEQHAEHRVPLAKLIWLSSLQLTNYDFRVGNSISVLAVGAVAFAMIWSARRLRGWTSFSDSFFPLAFLNFGQGGNFLWWFVFHHILAPVLACCLLLIILLRGNQLTPRYGILTGACLLLLSLSGPGGLPYVVALAIWLGYQSGLYWRSPSELRDTRDWLLVMGLAVLAVLLVGLYFVDYANAPGTAAGQPVPEVSLKASLETSIQILSISLGPAVRPYWRLVGSAVLMLLLLSLAVLIVALLKEPRERLRVLGLLLFIGAAGSLVLIVGRARAGLGEEYALSGMYLNMALPALCCAYFIWIVHGTPAIKSLVQMCLFIITCLFFLPNLAHGLGVGRYFSTSRQAFEQDMRAGVPSFILAERHVAFLNPATDDVKGIALRLRQMQQAGIPQFRDMAPDPAFREVALPVAPAGVSKIMWHNGVGYSYTDDPSQASVSFAFKEPRFVYAIRLRYAYGEKTNGQADFRISWGVDGHDSGTNGGDRDCKGGVALRVETIPHDIWSKRYRGGPQKSLTIWVNSTTDGFRICPDAKPFSFAVSEITLLVP
jgi:hypothetical protein